MLTEHASGACSSANAFRYADESAVEILRHIRVVGCAPDVEDLLPGDFRGFASGRLLDVLDLLQNIGNPWEEFASLERFPEEGFKSVRVHTTECFEPQRQDRHNILLEVDAEAEEPLPN